MNPLLKSLKARHGIIETKISHEQKARMPDGIRLSALKKLKLRIRDQIAILERLDLGQRPMLPSGEFRMPKPVFFKI